MNQLLDFRKLEMQGERLSVSMGDIVVFVRDAVEAFCELVKEKGVTLAFESKIGHLYMNYDHDKVYKVVNNLLSNAVKFTPSGGRIAVRVENSVRNGREYVAVSVGIQDAAWKRRTKSVYLPVSIRWRVAIRASRAAE